MVQFTNHMPCHLPLKKTRINCAVWKALRKTGEFWGRGLPAPEETRGGQGAGGVCFFPPLYKTLIFAKDSVF